MRVLRVVLVIEDDVLLHQISIGKIEIMIFMRSRMHRPTFMFFFRKKLDQGTMPDSPLPARVD